MRGWSRVVQSADSCVGITAVVRLRVRILKLHCLRRSRYWITLHFFVILKLCRSARYIPTTCKTQAIRKIDNLFWNAVTIRYDIAGFVLRIFRTNIYCSTFWTRRYMPYLIFSVCFQIEKSRWQIPLGYFPLDFILPDFPCLKIGKLSNKVRLCSFSRHT